MWKIIKIPVKRGHIKYKKINDYKYEIMVKKNEKLIHNYYRCYSSQ